MDGNVGIAQQLGERIMLECVNLQNYITHGDANGPACSRTIRRRVGIIRGLAKRVEQHMTREELNQILR